MCASTCYIVPAPVSDWTQTVDHIWCDAADEELARSNTIQKTVSSFGRSFTLTGKKKMKVESSPVSDAKEEEDEGGEDEEDEAFNWVRASR